MKGFTKMGNNERKIWDYVDNRGFDSQNNKTAIKVPANADEYKAKCNYLHNQIVELTNEIKEMSEAYTNKECGAFLRNLYDNGNASKKNTEPTESKTMATEIIQAWGARDGNGHLFAYEEKPRQEVFGKEDMEEEGIWTVNEGECMELPKDIFPEIQWTDKEPTPITITITKNE